MAAINLEKIGMVQMQITYYQSEQDIKLIVSGSVLYLVNVRRATVYLEGVNVETWNTWLGLTIKNATSLVYKHLKGDPDLGEPRFNCFLFK